MSVPDLDGILSKHIGEGKKIISSDITRLVGPGENYGGELLKLDVKIQDERTQETEVIHAVAKKIPPFEMFQKIFNIQKTFKGEIAFYEKIVPLLRDFQREHGVLDVIDSFAELYGSRINMNGTDVVDSDAAIIFENLKVSGYQNLDRHVGYNLEESEILLKDLATLHAVPLAIKMKNPDLFQNEVRPLLNNALPMPEDENHSFKSLFGLVMEILYESDKCAPAIPKVKKAWNKYYDQKEYIAREPFATFCHADLWVNNALMKYEDGRPIKNKFVDFQVYDYKSPVIDFLNFMFTSVQNDVLRDDFVTLLKFYHAQLVDNLKRFGCDVEPFSYSEFLKEFPQDTFNVLVWSLTFVPFVIFGPKGGSPPPPEEHVDFNDSKVRDEIRKTIPLIAKEKMQLIVEHCANNKWI